MFTISSDRDFDPFGFMDRAIDLVCFPQGRRPPPPDPRSFPVDIAEEDGRFVLSAELPGFGKDRISIGLDGDILKISAGNDAEKAPEAPAEARYIRKERRAGPLSRSFRLEGVDADAISASYADGVLVLDLPKAKPDGPARKTIDIA